MKRILVVCLIMMIGAFSLSADTDKPILTVLDFDASEISEAEMKSIINILSSGLFKSGLFTVIDVAQREIVLKELEFSLSGCIDESCMLEVGKMLSAELIVGGSMSRLGSKIVLSAKMIETETSKTVSTADGVYNDMDDLLENIYNFRDQLAEPYTESDSEPLPVKAAETIESEEPKRLEVPQESPDINIPAVTAAVGGAVSLGVSVYFLAVSIPLLSDYTTAQRAYDEAAEGDDYDALYNAAESARIAAVDGRANANFIIGVSLAGLGAGLGVLSAVLFTGEPAVEAAFIPGVETATLSFRFSY